MPYNGGTGTLTTAQIVLLGGIAGSTIFLGLPLGRLKNPSSAVRASLTALATGILIFLLIDVAENGFEPVGQATTEHHWSELVGYFLLFAGGLAAGLMSLVYYERWMGRERQKTMLGPGAASAAEFEANWVAGLSPGKWLALLIATGIGLHNFSEGLAIGQAGATGEIALALVLIIGFGLHNATEGFGIVAPLSGRAAELEVPRAPRPDRRRPDLRRHASSARLGRARRCRSRSSPSPPARSSTSSSSS